METSKRGGACGEKCRRSTSTPLALSFHGADPGKVDGPKRQQTRILSGTLQPHHSFLFKQHSHRVKNTLCSSDVMNHSVTFNYSSYSIDLPTLRHSSFTSISRHVSEVHVKTRLTPGTWKRTHYLLSRSS